MTDSIHEANKHMVGHVLEKAFPHIVTANGKGGNIHMELANKTQPHFNNLMAKMKSMKGGSGGTGGSIYMGGAFDNPYNMYHSLLKDVSPHKFEMMREIAAQQLGAAPSHMWGKLVPEEEVNKLESDPEEYERIMEMPNTHSAAKMIEAEKDFQEGGGFFKALKHVAKKAHKIYNLGSKALDVAHRNKDWITKIPGIDKYSNEINSFLDSASSIRDNIQPMADIISEVSENGVSPEMKEKVKQHVKEGIGKAIDKYTPEYSDSYKRALEAWEQV